MFLDFFELSAKHVRAACYLEIGQLCGMNVYADFCLDYFGQK